MSHNEDEIFPGIVNCFCKEPEAGMCLACSRKNKGYLVQNFSGGLGGGEEEITDLRVKSKLDKQKERI